VVNYLILPSDLQQWHIIKTCGHLLLHMFHVDVLCIDEVRLVEQYAMTAAGHSTLGALEIFAFSFESFLGVKSLFFEDDCQGTPAAYPPVTVQGCLNGCGSAKAG
jgi:hypothetical protein